MEKKASPVVVVVGLVAAVALAFGAFKMFGGGKNQANQPTADESMQHIPGASKMGKNVGGPGAPPGGAPMGKPGYMGGAPGGR